jgi:glycosyltransferase involved in cell wall biosynthesis
MDSPAISIIIPCYNYARFLRDAVHSLVGGPTCLGDFAPQTFQNFDIWIVNDASTDDTEAVAQSLVGDRIHYIANTQNIGTAATLNVGIKQASGQYITFLSADDMMESTRLEKLYQACLANPHRMAYDDLKIFDGKARTDTWPMSEYDFDRFLYKNGLHAGLMYPKQAWAEVGGYPEIMNDGREDWAFGVALGAHGWCGVHVKEPLYLYRRAGQNRSLHNTGGEWRMRFLNKMQALYPALYRGERPNMCCGNTKNVQRAAAQNQAMNVAAGGVRSRASARMRIGTSGMVELEYQLPKAGTVNYTGAVTGQDYAFSMIHKRGYVDVRDAEVLLNRIEDRRRAFILVNAPEPVMMEPPTKVDEPLEPIKPELETEELVIAESVPQVAQALPPKPRKPRKPNV